MRIDEFETHLNRLRDVFGDRNYTDERAKVFWREVRDMDASWWARTVDRFIGECKFAPLMPEFREVITRERERNWSVEKSCHTRDAKEFFLIADDPEIRGSVMKTILDRMNGKVSDQVWGEFMPGLNKLVGNK